MKRTILLLIICFLLGYQAIGSEVRVQDITIKNTTEENNKNTTEENNEKKDSTPQKKDGTRQKYTIQYSDTILEIKGKAGNITTNFAQFTATSSDTNVLKVSKKSKGITVTPIGEGKAWVTILNNNDSSTNRINYTVRLPYDSLKAEIGTLKAERAKLKAERDELQKQLDKSGHAPSNEWGFNKLDIILGIIAGLLLIILIIVLVLKKKADAQTLGSQTELQGMIDDLEDKVQSLTKEKAELESQKSNWEREKRSLEQEITGLRNKKAPVAPIAPSPKPAPPQPQSLYADAIVNGKFNRVKEQPDPAETNFELRLDSPTATSAKIYIYPGAERRILANPAFLEGCDKQILGNSRVETTHPGLAQKEGENNWVVTKKPEVIIR